MAKVRYNRVLKNISIESVPEPKAGDYMVVHAGSALTILKTREDENTLEL